MDTNRALVIVMVVCIIGAVTARIAERIWPDPPVLPSPAEPANG
jgi:hypothetical protein